MYNQKDLLTASEIQKELSKKGKFMTPSQIGAIAKHLNMTIKTNLGYNLYNRKLIDYIIKEKYVKKRRDKNVYNDNSTNTGI
jgi:phage antirepressor YoqD-like protein